MIRSLVLAALTLFNGFATDAVADERPDRQVFSCHGATETDDPRLFQIFRTSEGLRGELTHGFSWYGEFETHHLACQRVGRGHRYRCENADYEVTVFRASSSRGFTVSVSLTGDFGIFDSGYLYSIHCPR